MERRNFYYQIKINKKKIHKKIHMHFFVEIIKLLKKALKNAFLKEWT